MNEMKRWLSVLLVFVLSVVCVLGGLEVEVTSPEALGQRILINLSMHNQFLQKIESARATVFLLDPQGRVVGQSAKWVIGGAKDDSVARPQSRGDLQLCSRDRQTGGHKSDH